MALMDEQGKYVIVEDEYEKESPILFPSSIMHDQGAFYYQRGGGELISAGFFRIQEGVVSTFGKSVNLKLDSRPEDAQIIADFLGLKVNEPKQFECDEKLGDRCATQCNVCREGEARKGNKHVA